MNKQKLEQYRQRLLDMRAELEALAETGEAAAQTVELDQSKVGRLSRMDAMQAQAMSIEANRRREQELRQITAALNKINDGDYGYCVSCDEAIAEKRLDINPATSLCINCASEQER